MWGMAINAECSLRSNCCKTSMYVYQSDHCIAHIYLYLLVFIDAQIACLCLKYQKNGLLNGHIQNSKLALVHAKNSLSIPFIIILLQNRMFEKERITVKIKTSIKNIYHFKWGFDNTFILTGLFTDSGVNKRQLIHVDSQLGWRWSCGWNRSSWEIGWTRWRSAGRPALGYWLGMRGSFRRRVER